MSSATSHAALRKRRQVPRPKHAQPECARGVVGCLEHDHQVRAVGVGAVHDQPVDLLGALQEGGDVGRDVGKGQVLNVEPLLGENRVGHVVLL